MFVIDSTLARYLGNTCCVRKCKIMGIENLIIVALKHIGSKFATLAYDYCEIYSCFKCFIHVESKFREKIRTSD